MAHDLPILRPASATVIHANVGCVLIRVFSLPLLLSRSQQSQLHQHVAAAAERRRIEMRREEHQQSERLTKWEELTTATTTTTTTPTTTTAVRKFPMATATGIRTTDVARPGEL